MDEAVAKLEQEILADVVNGKPVIKELPLPKGLELFLLLNNSATCFKKRSGFYGYECFNERNEQFPFLVRLVRLDEDPAKITFSSRKHIELLGDEFVYPLRRFRIYDPPKVETIRQRFLADTQYNDAERLSVAKKSSFDVFVQRLREGHGPAIPLWEYVLKFHDNQDNQDPLLQKKVVTFLDRLKRAVDLGWVFDLPSFPQSENQVGYEKNRDNAIVDNEGPVFLDVEAIFNAHDNPQHEVQHRYLGLSCNVALQLLRGNIKLNEAFEMIKRGERDIVTG